MRPDADNFESWNEEHARLHDLDKFYKHPNRLFRYIENKRVSTLISFSEINDGELVLESGCGIGNILERIDRGNLYGVDISAIQIERAKKRLGERVKLFKCPAENTPFEDGYFDKIICTEVLEHVLEPEKILSEMKRILKARGIISLSIPNENLINFTKKIIMAAGLRRILEPKESHWDLASKNNLDEWHLHSYSLKLIKEQLKGKFEIMTVRKIPFFFIPFRYVLKLKKQNA